MNGTVLDFCVCIQNDTRETLPQGCILLSAGSDVQSDSPMLGSTVVLREGGTLWILARLWSWMRVEMIWVYSFSLGTEQMLVMAA